jgi:hypothetical protein
MSCEVCSGWVTYCHQCLTCFKGLYVYAPRVLQLVTCSPFMWDVITLYGPNEHVATDLAIRPAL